MHEGALHASARLHLQPTYHCPAFDSLLQSAARSTGIITAIEAEMAGVFSAAILVVLDDPVLLALTRGLLPVTARRPGAARRRLRQLWRRSSAAARTGRHRRASRTSPAALATPRGSPTAATSRQHVPEKMCVRRCSFLALCVRLRACHARF